MSPKIETSILSINLNPLKTNFELKGYTLCCMAQPNPKLSDLKNNFPNRLV